MSYPYPTSCLSPMRVMRHRAPIITQSRMNESGIITQPIDGFLPKLEPQQNLPQRVPNNRSPKYDWTFRELSNHISGIHGTRSHPHPPQTHPTAFPPLHIMVPLVSRRFSTRLVEPVRSVWISKKSVKVRKSYRLLRVHPSSVLFPPHLHMVWYLWFLDGFRLVSSSPFDRCRFQKNR